MIEKFSYKKPVVIGLGQTGFSCVRYLKSQGFDVSVTDNRINPPMLKLLQQQYPDVVVKVGEYNQQLLAQADCLVISPGVNCYDEAIARCIRQGVHAVGDVFCKHVNELIV